MEEGRGAPVDNDVFTGFNFFEVELGNKPSTAQPWAAWELMSALYRTAGEDCKNGIPVIHEYRLRTQGIVSHDNFDIFVLICFCKLRRSAPYHSRSSKLVFTDV